MIFRHSAVTHFTRDTLTETADRLPAHIHPALLGSGELGLGLDATGMQGLNTRMRQFRDIASHALGNGLTHDNLALTRGEVLSQHHLLFETGPEEGTEHHMYWLLPGGWLDYVLTIDGDAYDSARIAAEGTQWQRTFSPLRGIVTTSFRLGPLTITWEAGLAPDAVCVDFRFRAESHDASEHQVTLEVRCHQTTREEIPLASGGVETRLDDGLAFRTWQAMDATSTARLIAPVMLSWGLACSDDAEYAAEDTAIICRRSAAGCNVHTGIRVIAGSDRNDTESQEYARSRAEAFRADGAGAALETIERGWADYFADGAEMWIGDPEKEYLTLQQQYLLRAGAPWHAGYPLGTLWNNSHLSCTFWDTFFCCDGMLRAGHAAQVRAFCHWLLRSAQSTGRPHYWMTYYTGLPAGTNDQAYQVMLAFAGAAIRLYEVTHSPDDLRTCVFPYLLRTADHLLAEAIVYDEKGWHLRGGVAGDVDEEVKLAETQAGILTWVVATLAKCAEYADILGVDTPVVDQCRHLARWFRQRPIDLSNPGRWDTWIPYITGAEPFADYESWWQFTNKMLSTVPMCMYQPQPWPSQAVSASLSITGHPDLALQFQEDCMKFVRGLGYFDETPHEYRMGCALPYPPATGSWLSCMLVMFAHATLWDDEVQVGMALPTRWRYEQLRWRNVVTPNGARVSGSYDPQHLAITVERDRPCRLRARIPARMVGEPITVTVNGQAATPEIDGEAILLDLPAGVQEIAIARDLTSEADILLVEPLDYGDHLVELLTAEGYRVRRLRDYDTLPRVIDTAPLIILPVNYVGMLRNHVALLEAAVRKGTRLLTLFHGGCSGVDAAMADLCGVRATLGCGFWEETSETRRYALTEEGRSCFPDLPDHFDIPVYLQFLPRLADGVQVLATEGENIPVITLRPLDEGMVAWMAASGNRMDNKAFGWFESGREVLLFGKDFANLADWKWLRDAHWQQLFLGMVKRLAGVKVC